MQPEWPVNENGSPKTYDELTLEEATEIIRITSQRLSNEIKIDAIFDNLYYKLNGGLMN